MLMGFPSRVVPVEDVQYRVPRVIQYLGALVGVNHDVEVRSVEKVSPTLCHSVHHHSFDLINGMSSCVVRIDNLVGLEQAVIFICRKVVSDLRGQDVVVWISIGQLLHWLEVDF